MTMTAPKSDSNDVLLSKTYIILLSDILTMSVADEVIVEIRRVPKSDIYGFIELNCLYFHTTLYNIFIIFISEQEIDS